MKLVFADTSYFVAITRPRDPWQAVAIHARKIVGRGRLITTDEVLVECLNALRRAGVKSRQNAVKMVKAILSTPDVCVIPQSRHSFMRGIQLYECRMDKDYSLTDCISMALMREKHIQDVLTTDHHFAQEGFRVLIR